MSKAGVGKLANLGVTLQRRWANVLSDSTRQVGGLSNVGFMVDFRDCGLGFRVGPLHIWHLTADYSSPCLNHVAPRRGDCDEQRSDACWIVASHCRSVWAEQLCEVSTINSSCTLKVSREPEKVLGVQVVLECFLGLRLKEHFPNQTLIYGCDSGVPLDEASDDEKDLPDEGLPPKDKASMHGALTRQYHET